jgi:cytochrome c oxidase subunit 4
VEIEPVTQTPFTGPLPGSWHVYGVIWACLMMLTGLTVAAASLHMGGVAIVVCLSIAAVKSTLVFLYFMHLRHEKRLIIRWVLPVAFCALAIFIAGTFSDVISR